MQIKVLLLLVFLAVACRANCLDGCGNHGLGLYGAYGPPGLYGGLHVDYPYGSYVYPHGGYPYGGYGYSHGGYGYPHGGYGYTYNGYGLCGSCGLPYGYEYGGCGYGIHDPYGYGYGHGGCGHPWIYY